MCIRDRRQEIPRTFELTPAGERRELRGRFRLIDGERFGFAIDDRDLQLAAVLDPQIAFGTYVGGSECDIAYDAAVDQFGDGYVVGISQSSNFPTTPGAADPTAVDDEAFVFKLNRAGDTLLWATYLGGSDDDLGRAIRVNTAGTAVWVTGQTDSFDFPTTAGASTRARACSSTPSSPASTAPRGRSPGRPSWAASTTTRPTTWRWRPTRPSTSWARPRRPTSP